MELIICFAKKELDLVELFCFFCNHVKTGIDKEDVLFLVDHYIPCANEVVGCIDHHPGVCVFSAKENFFEIASSSCTKIIFDLMLEAWMEETKDMVYKTIMSIYGDTLSLTLESKVVTSDKKWIKQKIKEYNFSESDFVPSGLRLTNVAQPFSEILKNKFKKSGGNSRLLVSEMKAGTITIYI